MTLALPGAPFPVTYRELWLPPGIKGWTGPLPPSVEGGQELTFTGARHGTTVDGVHFTGAATSNINCGAIHNNAATYWVSFRFKLDQPYAAGSGDMYLWGKFVDATHFVWLVLKTADGKLYFEGQDGGANDFSIAAQDGAADITTWEAGRWYNTIASISAANDVRFIIDNGTVVTVVTAIAFPNGGDFIIGDYDDPGAGTGFEGIIADFFGSTVDNTVAEEANLYKGFPPGDVVNAWLLDEGRGVTSYDRGPGADNGTLDTTATWAFGQVQQPVISFNALGARAASPAAVNIVGDLTLIWVAKMKSTYDAIAGNREFVHLWIDANNNAAFMWRTNALSWIHYGSGTYSVVNHATKPSIDDYLIFIGTLVSPGVLTFFVNGVYIGTDLGAGVFGGGLATVHLASYSGTGNWDISKHLFLALVDGAFTHKQARAYSRYLRNIFNLPITV